MLINNMRSKVEEEFVEEGSSDWPPQFSGPRKLGQIRPRSLRSGAISFFEHAIEGELSDEGRGTSLVKTLLLYRLLKLGLVFLNTILAHCNESPSLHKLLSKDQLRVSMLDRDL